MTYGHEVRVGGANLYESNYFEKKMKEFIDKSMSFL